MNQAPTVSVCIPTYRGAAHLGATIESVLNQDFTDFELVVIDDNSPDNTSTIVSSFHDNRIRYIKNASNLGPEGNWNRCLEEATGKYFKLLPQDDVLAPNCLREQIEVLENDYNHTISFVFSARNIINKNGDVLMKRGYPGGVKGAISNNQAIKHCIRCGTNLIGEPGTVMFRKSLIDKIGKFDGSISYIIDLDYWFRLLLQGDAYYLDAPLVSFRVSSGSWSVAINNNQSTDFCNFIERCANNPDFKLKFVDKVIGKCMAKINNYLRMIFYKIAI
jgi:glycosyltransferase involved in cell wall biosynthesis